MKKVKMFINGLRIKYHNWVMCLCMDGHEQALLDGNIKSVVYWVVTYETHRTKRDKIQQNG